MSLKKNEIFHIISELQVLLGAQIQKITQPSPQELIWHIRLPRESLYLIFSVEPGFTRLHLMRKKLPSLPSPPVFCMTQRKHLANARIQSIKSHNEDRIVEISLRRAEEETTFFVELIPKHPNLFLCDGAKNLMHSLSPLPKHRGLQRGEPYIAPIFHELKQESQSFEALTFEKDQEQSRWDICKFNQEIAAQYAQKSSTSRLQKLRVDALRGRRKSLKKSKRLYENLKKDQQKCKNTLDNEKMAELLKSNLHQIKKGQELVEVVDYYDPEMAKVQIKLDPKRNPQQNLQKLFQSIKRAKKGLHSIEPRLDDIEMSILLLEEEIEKIESIDDLETLYEYLPTTSATDTKKTKKKKQEQKSYHNTFISNDGYPIYVGKNSKANDYLSLKIAKGNDLWLHAKGYAGSHVVVPLQKGKECSAETLLDAATLAAHYSKAKNQTHIEIMHTQAKYVKKAKHSLPGQVSVIRSEHITIRMDANRVQRLFKDRKQG